MVKKICWLITCLTLCVCSVFAVACGNKEPDETFELNINKTQSVLIVGQEDLLTVDYDGSETVEWLSDNIEVATVDNGKILAVGEGVAIVSATVLGETATCTVIVKKVDLNLLDLNFEKSQIEVETNGEYTIKYTVTHEGKEVTDAKVTFSCLENDILTITEDGKITGIKYGEATCIAKVEYYGEEKLTAFNVLVKSSATLKVENASFEIYALGEFGGESYENTKALTVKVTESGQEVSSPSITWSSDDESVCTVNSDGIVTGVGAGKTLVKARYTAQDGANLESSVQATVLRIEGQLNQTAIDVDKDIGYEMDKTTLFGDSDIEFTNVYLTDGEFDIDLVATENLVKFEETTLSGETCVCFETPTVLYKLNTVVWDLTIDSVEDFRELKNASFGWYKLGADVDLADEQWLYGGGTNVFSGVLDGKNYTVSNFNVSDGFGIFSNLGNGALIKNINIENAEINSEQIKVGVLAVATTQGAQVSIENVSVKVKNLGDSTGGFVGNLTMESVIDINKCFVHSYNPEGGTSNGSLFGISGGTCNFTDTKIYSNTKLCGEQDIPGNLSYEDINQADTVTVAPTPYGKELILFDKEIEFDGVDGEQAVFFGETIKELTISSGKITLDEGELSNFAGKNVEVFIKLAESVVYYVIHVKSEVEIDQSTAEYIFKLNSGNIKLIEDIDLSDVSGTPIPFSGTFDGQGYTISGIEKRRNVSLGTYSGVWATLSGATIKNVKLVAPQISDGMGIVAYKNDYSGNPVTIENVYVVIESVSEATASNYQGGLFRQVNLGEKGVTFLNLKDVVMNIKKTEINRVAFIGMCCGDELNLTDKNVHFIGGSGCISSWRSDITGYFTDDTPIKGSIIYESKADFDLMKDSLSFNDVMEKMLWGEKSAEKTEGFNPDWI